MPRTPKRPTQATPAAPVSPESASRAAVQPPRAPTGLPQGMHQELVQSQEQQPMANESGRLNAALQAAMSGPGGGGEPPLGSGAMMSEPTANPGEPVMTGAPMGPGAGPEAVQAPAIPTTPDDYEMAKFLPMLEMLADQTNVSNQTRNYVRRMRGTLPPAITMQNVVKPKPVPEPQ